jgi:putative flippase GtrA
MLKLLFWKFIKFCAVGGTGLGVDFGLTYLFKEKIKLNKYVANTIGFTVAASTNYILNRIWTFESHNPHIMMEYSKFIIISLLGLGINTLVLWFFVSRVKFNFYLSKLIAIGFVTLWNFVMNILFTFTLMNK